MSNYTKYRGRCKELSVAACESDLTLTLVRGTYWCPVWNKEEHHWWTVRTDGTIYDPSAQQFPSNGMGTYTPFDGFAACSECGNKIAEEAAYIDGRFAFCDSTCYCRFVGIA